jgi:hypothetical protein
MKAIVIVFRRTPDRQASPQQKLAATPGEKQLPLAGFDGSRLLPECNQTPPPFWTWFVENPRPLQSSDLAV